jgi:hypothetical protein
MGNYYDAINWGFTPKFIPSKPDPWDFRYTSPYNPFLAADKRRADRRTLASQVTRLLDAQRSHLSESQRSDLAVVAEALRS